MGRRGSLDGAGDAPPVRLPPARSGPKSLALIAAVILVFLGVLWYASFAALQSRGPDRAFLTQDSWENGTVVLVVTELDERGEVPIASLTVNLTAPTGEALYSGPPGLTQSPANFSLTLTYKDTDNSTTLTRGDAIEIRADPAEALDALILSNFYLYSDGREWSRLQLS